MFSFLALVHLAVLASALTQGPAGNAAGPSVAPPELLERVDALYPVGETRAATVVLFITVADTGEVKEVSVEQSAGERFDEAALQAARQWKFKPAQQDGVPVAVRLRIPFAFRVLAPPPSPSPSPSAPPSPAAKAKEDVVREVTVRGERPKPARGGSDFQLDVAGMAVFTTKGAQDLLQLAPGIFLANEGGEGHAEQVFLRGFNAEQGQAIEFTVNGVPINEVDNPDGHGYADTHFIIPELVKRLRVVEGPFDPHQGDFAMAGSADFELGVPQRGGQLSAWWGSFGTHRLLALYAPRGAREGTFAAVQFFQTDGYGVSRASAQGTAMGQYEGTVGAAGYWRLLASSYATHFKTAGVVRQDDFDSGKVPFYGSEDPSQGGDAQRHTLAFSLESPSDEGLLSQQLFLTYRTLRLLENFTGFIADDQQQGQSLHPQRGDGFQQSYQAVTPGIRGAYRWKGFFRQLEQALEVGYYGRYDHTVPEIERVRYGTQIPYRVDEAYTTDVLNVAGFVDLELRPLRRLVLRGGIRQEFFSYNVDNRCDTAGTYQRNQPLDDSCPSYDRSGPRDPSRRVSATGSLLEPKVSALFTLSPAWTLTGSFGLGAQSMSATLITQDQTAPFVKLAAGEGGLLFHRRLGGSEISARGVGYYTHVEQDQIFNPTLGRLASAPGTTRSGVVAALRVTGRHLDEMASLTYAHAVFDGSASDAQASATGFGGKHDLVPYIPGVVARSNTVLSGHVPGLRMRGVSLLGSLGAGLNFVGRRALPYGQSTDPTFSVDGSASLRWKNLEVGFRGTNLLDGRYPSSEFFYASDFRSRSYPTLAPARHFTAAPPRTGLFTFTIFLDQEAGE